MGSDILMRSRGNLPQAACGISTVANILVGASGHILFETKVKENILQNLSLDDLPAATVRALFGACELDPIEFNRGK